MRISLEEYLAIHEKPESELVAGALIPKPMGTLQHMLMEKALLRLLASWEETAAGEAIHELSVRHGEDVRIPDVVLFPKGARFEKGLLIDPPFLCVEVLSPSQRPSELFAKCEVYHSWGVPYCWVIDPIGKAAWEYHKDSPLRDVAGSLRAGEVAVAFADLFGTSA